MSKVRDEDRIRGEEIGVLFAQVRGLIWEIRNLSEDFAPDAIDLICDLQRLIAEINGLMSDLNTRVALAPTGAPVLLADLQTPECNRCSYREQCRKSDYPLDRDRCPFWVFSWSGGP